MAKEENHPIAFKSASLNCNAAKNRYANILPCKYFIADSDEFFQIRPFKGLMDHLSVIGFDLLNRLAYSSLSKLG